jgi:hypothetical protein
MFQAYSCPRYFAFFFAVAFFVGGLPRFITPAAISQFGSLHFGQECGLPSMRFTQEWLHRRQSQIMLFGIGIFFWDHTIFSIDS